VDDLFKIFEKTFEDKKFSRAEKKAIRQLLRQDYSLKKDQRDLLRDKIFDIARKGVEGHLNQSIIDWLETANKVLLNRQDTTVYFSPGDECRQVIVHQLGSALSSVDICVYTISDDNITEEIVNCHKRKIKVRIITDDEKIKDLGSDIWTLAAYGIETRIDRSPHYMHHKFAIFDNAAVITGSYNWTRSAAEYNQENLLLTDDKRAVYTYKQEFEKLWETMKPLRKIP